jgi:hypothetical protein
MEHKRRHLWTSDLGSRPAGQGATREAVAQISQGRCLYELPRDHYLDGVGISKCCVKTLPEMESFAANLVLVLLG